ncbi:hemopexin [Tachyglossus aculeatus]|uniref:hemopexin n=1 Tax=Tachyglossus aculeatus TaxID=9261 RepID=UPI0018F6751E|nr:hemopexin [Tachyglossus aculeatus]
MVVTLVGVLGLSWTLALAHPLASTAPPGADGAPKTDLHPDEIGRCSEDWGFDAVTLDESGTMMYFRGESVWKKHSGAREPVNATWPEVGGHVDAAFRLHRPARPEAHDNVYLFRGEQVWVYENGLLKKGYPRLVSEEFPGIPTPLDAAVECHPGECRAEGILFFQGRRTWFLELASGTVKERTWPTVGNCTAALRWLGRYYCFQGGRFLRFDPVSGDVPPHYPRLLRDYFIRCPGRGHGHGAHQNNSQPQDDRCSGLNFSAFLSDDSGRIYAFSGLRYWRVDLQRDGWHAWPINHQWPEVQGPVDAAFSWEEKVYLIQDSNVYIYGGRAGFTLVSGYPRQLSKELGNPGDQTVDKLDAAFTCPKSSKVYLISGSHMWVKDLAQSHRDSWKELFFPHDHVDGALCTAGGLYLIQGPNLYRYGGPEELTPSTIPPKPFSLATSLLGCAH